MHLTVIFVRCISVVLQQPPAMQVVQKGYAYE